MKKTNKETLSTQLFIGLVVFCGISFGLGYYSTPSSETKKIHARAHRVFEYDKRNPDRLANRDVVALSVDLGFGNYKHASELLIKLEKQI